MADIRTIAKLKPMGDFAIADAMDIDFEGIRVDVVINQVKQTLNDIYDSIDEKADQSEVDELKTVVAGKAESSTVTAAQNDINVLKNRVDGIVALPDGSTTADAELVDIRTGADGKKYVSAGTAVREQVSGLKSDLKKQKDNNFLQKNYIDFPYDDKDQKTTGGITFSVNSDGTIHAEGTATGSSNSYFFLRKFDNPQRLVGRYRLTGSPANGLGKWSIRIGKCNNTLTSWSTVASEVGDGLVYNFEEGVDYCFVATVNMGNTVDITFKPELIDLSIKNNKELSEKVQNINNFGKWLYKLDGTNEQSARRIDVAQDFVSGQTLVFRLLDSVGGIPHRYYLYFFRADGSYQRYGEYQGNDFKSVTLEEDFVSVRLRVEYTDIIDTSNLYSNMFFASADANDDFVAQIAAIEAQRQKDSKKLEIASKSVKIFKKVCCCGDSYTAGYIVDKDGVAHRVNEDYAWPHYMATATGNDWVNCGHSGTSAYTWQIEERGLPKARTTGKVQAYTVGLMINDSSDDPSRNLALGIISDIGTDAMTYYAQYSKVIRELSAISPDAHIFLFTCPKVEGERYIGYNQAVHDIYEAYKATYKVHLIDLFANFDLYNTDTINTDKKSGHYTATGYEKFAEILEKLMSEYIDSHVRDFQDVAFIEYD